MPLPVGGFLSALGGAFGGYAKDQDDAEKKAQLAAQLQRQSALDAQNAQLHGAQMSDYAAQARLRDQQAEHSRNSELTMTRDWGAAKSGDTDAQSRILSYRPELATEFQAKVPADPYGGRPRAQWLQDLKDEKNAKEPLSHWSAVPNALDPITKRPIEVNSATGEFRVASAGEMMPRGSKGQGAASGQTMGMLARVAQVYNDLGAADPQMKPFEDPKSPRNISQVGPIMKGMNTMADQQPSLESRGFWGATGNAMTSAMSGLAQRGMNSSPLGRDARTYGTNVKRVGLGLAEINPRPNNALIGIETAMSTADLGNNPQQTKLVQDRRENARKSMKAILSMNPAYVEAMQAQDPDWINNQIHAAITQGVMPAAQQNASAGATDPAAQQRADWDAAAAALKAQGKDPLTVLGARP